MNARTPGLSVASEMTVVIAPGPAMSGMATGVTMTERTRLSARRAGHRFPLY